MSTLSNYSYRLTPPHSSSPSHHSHYSRDAADRAYRLEWPDDSINPRHFERAAQKAIVKLQNSTTKLSQEDTSGSSITSGIDSDSTPHDTVLYPLIQSGVLGIREEETVLSALFDHLLINPADGSPKNPAERSVVDLTSGYFALYEPYQLRSLKDGVDWRILAASPKVCSVQNYSLNCKQGSRHN